MHQSPEAILPVPLPTTTLGEVLWALGWFAVLAWGFWRFAPRSGQGLFTPKAIRGQSPLHLERKTLLLLFGLKALAAVAHGLIYYHFYRTGDAVHHFQDARKLWTLMPERPLGYLQLLFGYSADGQAPAHLAPVYETLRGSWRTTEYFAVRLHGLFNLFTGGHYYANLVLFNALLVLGLQQLFRAFARIWPSGAHSLLLPLVFLPSTLFWCSALHKDAMALLAMGLMLFAVVPKPWNPQLGIRDFGARPGIKRSKVRWRVVHLLLAFFILSQTRPYLMWVMVPNLAVLTLLLRDPRSGKGMPWTKRPLLWYAAVNVLAVLFMGVLGRLDPRFDLLERMAFETAFLQTLRGNALVAMPPLAKTLPELLQNLPMALWRVLWAPISGPHRHAFQSLNAMLSAAQLIAMALLLGWGLWRRWAAPKVRPALQPEDGHEQGPARHAPSWYAAASHRQKMAMVGFGGFVGLGVFLLVGLTVPQLGAIVRYKSAVLPIFFAALWIWAKTASSRPATMQAPRSSRSS